MNWIDDVFDGILLLLDQEWFQAIIILCGIFVFLWLMFVFPLQMMALGLFTLTAAVLIEKKPNKT